MQQRKIIKLSLLFLIAFNVIFQFSNVKYGRAVGGYVKYTGNHSLSWVNNTILNMSWSYYDRDYNVITIGHIYQFYISLNIARDQGVNVTGQSNVNVTVFSISNIEIEDIGNNTAIDLVEYINYLKNDTFNLVVTVTFYIWCQPLFFESPEDIHVLSIVWQNMEYTLFFSFIIISIGVIAFVAIYFGYRYSRQLKVQKELERKCKYEINRNLPECKEIIEKL